MNIIKKYTPQKIIDISTRLFAEKGFAAVSVREISTDADSNVSAVSYYFGGKSGLYKAVLEEQFLPLIEAMIYIKENEQLLPEERLSFYAENVSKIHSQRPYLSKFMISESLKPTPYGKEVIEKHLSQVYNFLAKSLREGIQSGVFREDLDITYTAVALASILNFYFVAKPLLQNVKILENPQDEAYTQNAFRIYLQGIKIDKSMNEGM